MAEVLLGQAFLTAPSLDEAYKYQPEKKARTNNTYNFILYNSCSMHNCLKTYNNKKNSAGTVPLSDTCKIAADLSPIYINYESAFTHKKTIR